ncbi:MAG TPA: PAS domain S-box protein, partial [Chthoniobacteraceae bacterium]
MIEASELSISGKLGAEPGFRAVFDPNPLPMLAFDDVTLSFVAVNDAAVEKYGWAREEFFEMTVEDLWVPEDVPLFRSYREERREDLSSGLNKAVPWRHRTRDGKVFSVDSSWHTIPFQGRTAVLLVMVDLTEQKRAEERSRQQASLLDLAADAIMVRDLDQRVLFWNQGAERLYGWSKAEAVGAFIRDLFPNEAERLAAAEAEFRERGVWIGEIEQKNKEG